MNRDEAPSEIFSHFQFDEIFYTLRITKHFSGFNGKINSLGCHSSEIMSSFAFESGDIIVIQDGGGKTFRPIKRAL
jgi:hypothetical protein